MKRIIILLVLFLNFYLSSEQSFIHHATATSILNNVLAEKGSKAVLLNFWATWCAPCVTEFPMIVDLADEFENDLAVYFVSVDWLDEKEKAISFMKKQGVDWTTFIKDEKDNAFINGIHEEWSGALPFTILYGKSSGEVLDYWEGEQPEKSFRKAIINAINS